MASIDLDALRLFVTVATRRSFSGAASEHGLHRSAVSRRIAALEQALGAELLIRTTRRVEPTTAGRRLLEEVAPLLTAVERAVGRLPEAADAPAGTLRLSAPRDVGSWLLPPVLGALAAAHPAIRPAVELSNRQVDIEGEGFDAALRITRDRLAGSGLRARRIGTIRVRVYASPGYVARRGAPSRCEELEGHTVVGLRGVVPKALGEAAALVSAGDMLLAAELAKEGVGVAFLPRFVAADAVRAGQLVRLMGDDELVAAGLHLVFPNLSRLPAKSVAFREAVLRFMAEHPLD
ncbi:MAG: LysR substrate-binding domain-containing protein [Myxococcota bacterium]